MRKWRRVAFAMRQLKCGYFHSGEEAMVWAGITEAEYREKYARRFMMTIALRQCRDFSDRQMRLLSNRLHGMDPFCWYVWLGAVKDRDDHKDAGPDASVEQREVETNQLWATARRDLDPYMIPDMVHIVLDYLA